MSYTLLEFACDQHGRFEELHERATAPDVSRCPSCGSSSPWVISAPKPATVWGAVVRGSFDNPPPGALDTRPLADGMPSGEFKRKRQRERREARLMKLPAHVRRVVEKQGG